MASAAPGLVFIAMLTGAAGALMADGLPPSLKDGAPLATPCCDVSWSGFYLAGGIGYSGSAPEILHEVNAGAVSIQHDGLSAHGPIGMAVAGYDQAVGEGYIFGVFADCALGKLEDASVLIAPGYAQPYRLSLENSWAVGARFGLTRTPSTLWYLTAGYTQTEVNFDDLSSETLEGIFAGAGVEQKLSPTLSLKLEYRYANFQEETLFETSGSVCGGCSQRVAIDPAIHSLRLGISYRFGQ